MSNYYHAMHRSTLRGDTKSEVQSKVKDLLSKFKDDPASIPYNFNVDYRQIINPIPAKVVVYKRRQLTTKGSPAPQSPCDDKGLPKTDEHGKILWGPWFEGSKAVSVENKTYSASNCRPNKLYWGSTTGKPEAEKIIEKDKRIHLQQQEKRKNPIHVDYKIKEVEKPQEEKYWNAYVESEKVREYPSSWKELKFDVSKNAKGWVNPPPDATDFEDVEFNYPIKISFYTYNDKGKRVGVGNYKGRKAFTSKVQSHKLFAIPQVQENLEKLGFTPSANRRSYGYFSTSMHTPAYYSKDVPNSSDQCVVDIEQVKGGQYYYNAVHKDNLKIKGTPKFQIFKNVNGERYQYREKAPKKSVDFCADLFEKSTRNAMIVLDNK